MVTIEVYVTRDDGEQAVAQLQVEPGWLKVDPEQRPTLIGQQIDPLICWGLGDARYTLTKDGLVEHAVRT